MLFVLHHTLTNFICIRVAVGRAARFDLCLLLEAGHYSYIGRIEQLFKMPRYCIDCERKADRLYHWTGCSVACRLCMRFGADYPCQQGQVYSIHTFDCTVCFCVAATVPGVWFCVSQPGLL